MNFPIIKPNNISIAGRKLIYGKAINDADYMVQPIINGKHICCPYYRVWKNMLMRIFDQNYQAKFPTYKDCSIDDVWLRFSNFKSWMEKQDWKNNHLDKDLLVIGNKVYGPKTCIFISPELNYLLIDSGAKRGKYPQGVSFYSAWKKFVAEVSIEGNRTRLGGYDSPEEAETVYKIAKAVIIARAAANQNDSRIRNALMTRAHDLNVGASA